MGHVQLQQYGFRARLIFPSYFRLFLLRASLDQSKTSTKQKTQAPICGNKLFALSRNVGANEASKIAVNARVVIFGKVQTDKDGISHCIIRIPNFSMCHKLLQNFVEKLQQENYYYRLVMQILERITLDRNTA